jgi:hypothetical protein
MIKAGATGQEIADYESSQAANDLLGPQGAAWSILNSFSLPSRPRPFTSQRQTMPARRRQPSEDTPPENLSITQKSIPSVTNPKLSNIVNDLYKGARRPNPIGTGSTADAVRNELATGLPTHGRFHAQKAQEYSHALRNWLRNNPNASRRDRLVAQSLLDDLKSALGGN